VGSRFAVACSSGTAAIHVALRLLGVGAGDDVLVSDLTFIASVNPIAYEGARPVLVDAEPATWNIDPGIVADELARRARAGRKQPKAVEVVHLLGHPADIEPIAEACYRHGVVLVEDAAEALGASYRGGRFAGKHVGTVGRIGCFSFNGNKIITTGGGGMMTTDDPALARRAKHLTTQARLPGAEYAHDEIGYNYRLTNLAAALGLSQLELLDDFVARKAAIAARYDAFIAETPGMTPPPRAAWASPTYWLYSARIDPAAYGADRTAVMERLRSSGIESRPIWSPIHRTEPYRGAERLGGDVADRLFAEALSLPSSVNLAPAAQERVIAALRQR
jgi:dTDP-4-amino-4,6-dideoxygalactose transaminase